MFFLALCCTPVFGNKPMVIVSGSMEPTIKTNALTLVHKCKLEDVKVGDIITYYHPRLDEFITHRVVEKGEDFAITQGDANSVRDDIAVLDENIYGKVILTANWLAPILGPIVNDRTFDRPAAISMLFLVATVMSILWVVIALVAVYVYALYIVFHRPPTEDEIAHIFGEAQREMYADFRNTETLTIIQRVRLQVLYRTYKRETEDAIDELNHILHRKKAKK